jgi:hypothetical protein
MGGWEGLEGKEKLEGQDEEYRRWGRGREVEGNNEDDGEKGKGKGIKGEGKDRRRVRE